MTTIGLLGGGQLGRMLQEAASPLGVEIAVLDTADCPTKQINSNPKNVTGSFKDPEKIRELAARCDVLTVEIEHVNTEVLEEIATKGISFTGPDGVQTIKKVPVHPSWETLRLIQDKFLQKEHFRKANIPVAPQIEVSGSGSPVASVDQVAAQFGYPFMLKARKGSYDGRGNAKVASEDDFREATKTLGSLSLYAEKWVPFKKELAVMVVRTEDDQGNLRDVLAYPAVETVHQDSICTKVFSPPRGVVSSDCERARTVAADVVRSLKGRGVYAVEMFLLEDGSVLVNEVAPRPHNSGHYTIEAVPQMSQYKAQLFSVLDYRIEQSQLRPRVSGAIMLNILGGAKEDSHSNLVRQTFNVHNDQMDVYLHLYGKQSKPGRKIGHITVTSYSSGIDLERHAKPLVQEVDRIRQERLGLRTTQQAEISPEPSQQHPKKPSSRDRQNPLVVVTMGSDSDLHVLKGAFDILEHFHIPYDFTITSAHRTPHRMVELAKSAAARGVKVIIAAAGGAAHLPGMVASETTVPVIGVPVKATHLDGMDSLLSIVQMPRGCPVATVGVNNSTNAGLLAAKILGTRDPAVERQVADYMAAMRVEVEAKAERLEEIGWASYLEAAKK